MRNSLRPSPPAGLWIVLCALVAGALPAAGEVAVTGLELRLDADGERLRVFADGPLEPRLVELDERTLMLALPGAVLGESAPGRIAPTAQGTVRRVSAFETPVEAGDLREVRVVIHRRPGPPPRLDPGPRGLSLAFEAANARTPASANAGVSVQYRGVPLARFVSDLARATGETLVFDETLGGLVTIEGPPRVSRAEALALLDSVLLLRGYAAVPAPGGSRTIVEIAGAAGPWSAASALPESDAPVTTLLRLSSVEAEDVVAVLTPYLGGNTLALAFPPSNSVILSGAAQRLRRIRDMVETLDAVEPLRTVLWPLYHADAEQVAGELQGLLGEEALPLASSDLRNNSLLLGVRSADLERARRAVDRLDRPAPGRGAIHVIRLRHADPDTLAEQLVTLRDGGRGSASTPASFRGAAAGLEGLEFDVVVDAPTHSLVVRAGPEVMSSLLDLVREIDRQPTQVRVAVTVASVTISDQLDLGVDYLIPTLTNPKKPTDLIASVSSSLGLADASFTAAFTRAPLVLTVLDPVTGDQVPILNPLTGLPVSIPRESASITLNEGDVRTELLIQPELLANSGEEHRIFAGDEIPIPVGRTVEGQVATQLTQDIQRQDVGTTLRVLPTVGKQGVVVLELSVEVSELGASLAGDVSEVGPTLEEISVESLVRLEPGEVAVIATAARPIRAEASTGVPFLKDIPGLGFLFRATTERARTRYLLITASAQVLSDETRALAARLERLAASAGPAAAAEASGAAAR